jgi:hypothetical protein
MKVIFSSFLLAIFCLFPIFSHSMENPNPPKSPKVLQELCIDIIEKNASHPAIETSKFRTILLAIYKNLLLEKSKKTPQCHWESASITESPQPIDLSSEILLPYVKFAHSLHLEQEVKNEQEQINNEVKKSSKSILTRIQFFDKPTPCYSV